MMRFGDPVKSTLKMWGRRVVEWLDKVHMWSLTGKIDSVNRFCNGLHWLHHSRLRFSFTSLMRINGSK